MIRTNGAPISKEDFGNLEKGDPYFFTKSGSIRTAERFYDNEVSNDAVITSTGHKNSRCNMRWLTQSEYNYWRKANPLKCPVINEVKPQGATSPYVSTPPACRTVPHTSDTGTETRKKDNEMSAMTKTKDCVSVALTTVKNDAADAAWRTAAKQAIRSVKVPIVAFMGRQNLPGGLVGFLAAQLDTENGEAALALALGATMTYVPRLGTKPEFLRLAKELRVFGMEVYLSKVANVVLDPLYDQLEDILSLIPGASAGE